jgi:NAD(P)-dependent dehydrogenase (short-subunit alcohol dehydrogenase family)
MTTINLEGAVAVVIGSSEGIGAAIAIGLANAGAMVVTGGRDAERMSSTVGEIERQGGKVDFEPVDVREPESIKSFSAAIIHRHGVATILVNSMGGTLIEKMVNVDVDEWDNLHNTHLRGTLLSCQAFQPGMRASGYGKIINLSSLAGFRVAKNRGSYSVAKAGLNQLTCALASEWGQFGIRVNGIAPSTTRTPRASAQLEREPQRESTIVERTPIGRLATTDDMVGPALFLASPMSDFVSGQTLAVDGGMLTVR